MFKSKSILMFALLMFTFNPTTAILDQHQPVYGGDISGRWVDDMDIIDIKQSGDTVTGEIGIYGSGFSGTRSGDLITFSLEYRFLERGGYRKSVGELRINSDGTRLTGIRSGGAFKKDSEWILTKESD
jgi:hypothetical protein